MNLQWLVWVHLPTDLWHVSLRQIFKNYDVFDVVLYWSLKLMCFEVIFTTSANHWVPSPGTVPVLICYSNVVRESRNGISLIIADGLYCHLPLPRIP